MPNQSINRIMNADESGKELVEFAEQTARTLVGSGLETTQIRNIYTEARYIEALWSQDSSRALRRLIMLKPKMAYQAKRKHQVSLLRDILIEAIDEVAKHSPGIQQNQAFQRFLDLFEAILAYHKAYGGK